LGLILTNSQIHSQSLASTNLTTINVDDLSDEQILSYMQQAEASGYSEQQIEALARQRGMAESQISKLRRRIDRLKTMNSRSNNLLGKGSANASSRQSSNIELNNAFGEISKEREGGELSYTQKRIFGYSLFQNNQLDFSPNLSIPTPSNYQIGPGDELAVDLWGATQLNETLIVDPEGTVRPEGLRPIYVNGLSIRQLRKLLKDRYSEIYEGLAGREDNTPTIFIETSLTGIRTINVSVIGEVNNPGNYALNSLSTVYTALYASGGPNENGTFRNIQLIRDNKVLKTIDIYDFLTSGIKVSDVLLRSGDIVLVKPFLNRIELNGQVRREGTYELKQGESLSELLKYSSGFTDKAYQNRLQVVRTTDLSKKILTIDKDDFDSTTLKDGDEIDVKEIIDRFENRVIIQGAVYSPGQFELKPNMSLLDLIDLADGLLGDAFTQRVNLTRTNPDFTIESSSFNLNDLREGNIENVLLKNDDVVTVPSIYDLRNEFYVKISGLVGDEGTYPFINNMTVQDLIVLAGGVLEGASLGNIEIARRNNDQGLNNLAEIIRVQLNETLISENPQFLKPYDQVFVRTLPGYEVQKTIRIEGEVVSPGEYALSRKDERISDIINRAQGLTPYAYAKGAILIRKTEFAEEKSDLELSSEYLQSLQERVLELEETDNSNSMAYLVSRLEEMKSVKSDLQNGDEVGSQIKKDLLVQNAERDSLIVDIEIKEVEPVTLELDQLLNKPGSKYDLLLRPGDVISIPGKLETVRVAGEVTSPLNVRFDESYSFKDYIFQSGGYLQTSKKSRSYVQYPNGERQGVKRFLWFKNYPKIEPGSTIFVAKKPERAALSIQEIITASTGLATIALVISQLTN